MGDKIVNNEFLFISELKLFFNEVNQSNFHSDEKYNELITLLKKFTILIEDKNRVIELYISFFNIDELNQWQEDIYIEIQERLLGYSSESNKINL